MKTPGELASRLSAQWRRPGLRLARLTSPAAWPMRLPIGRPPPACVERDPERVRAHLQAWRSVASGEVEWEDVPYRGTGEPVRVPVYWKIAQPSQWAEACDDRAVAVEYDRLSRLCAETPEAYHSTWIGRFHLWWDKPDAVLRSAAQLAERLAPGCAGGLPLRGLAFAGVDTKFYETHRALLVALLDARFNGAASAVGLEMFLGAAAEGEHWVLVIDLDGGLLPFARQRVRTDDLAQIASWPGTHLLMVENERCAHQLPAALPGAVAVLGSGLDLGWIANPALDRLHLAYWGDIDTWGLRMLGLARSVRTNTQALLMNRESFDSYSAGRAVQEQEIAEPPPSGTLLPHEISLFEHIARLPLGRLEQEFLPSALTIGAITRWHAHARQI